MVFFNAQEIRNSVDRGLVSLHNGFRTANTLLGRMTRHISELSPQNKLNSRHRRIHDDYGIEAQETSAGSEVHHEAFTTTAAAASRAGTAGRSCSLEVSSPSKSRIDAQGSGASCGKRGAGPGSLSSYTFGAATIARRRGMEHGSGSTDVVNPQAEAATATEGGHNQYRGWRYQVHSC